MRVPISTLGVVSLGLMSCYGIAWFFRHIRAWTDEPQGARSEVPAAGVSVEDSENSELPEPPSESAVAPAGTTDFGLRGSDVLVFFAVWFLGVIAQLS